MNSPSLPFSVTNAQKIVIAHPFGYPLKGDLGTSLRCRRVVEIANETPAITLVLVTAGHTPQHVRSLPEDEISLNQQTVERLNVFGCEAPILAVPLVWGLTPEIYAAVKLVQALKLTPRVIVSVASNWNNARQVRAGKTFVPKNILFKALGARHNVSEAEREKEEKKARRDMFIGLLMQYAPFIARKLRPNIMPVIPSDLSSFIHTPT